MTDLAQDTPHSFTTCYQELGNKESLGMGLKKTMF